MKKGVLCVNKPPQRLDHAKHALYPAVYAGAELIVLFAVGAPIRSAVAGVGPDVSNGEVGFLIRVTQKHLAMPSSPRMRPTLRPRSSLFFMDPLKTQGAGFWFAAPSVGGEII